MGLGEPWNAGHELVMAEKIRPIEQMLELSEDEALSPQHLELIEAIDPKSWNPADLHKELSRALSAIDDARTEYSDQRSRLQATGDSASDMSLPDIASDAYESNNGRTFFQWVEIGIALTLPLIIFGVIALAFFFWMASR